MSDSPALADIFQQHTGRLIHKWSHYFPIYERHLGPYRNTPIRALEIGVFHGGSLQMWKRYFGEYAALVGVDIDPRCVDFAEVGIDIEIGDQSDPQFWQTLIESYGDFEVIIDDGSHVAAHQRASFLNLWPHLRDGGTYIVEDCHTAYWPEYGGGVGTGNSFIDFAKGKIDDLNARWSRDPQQLAQTRFTHEVAAVHFYDSMVVFEKKLRTRQPCEVLSGSFSHPVEESIRSRLEAHRGNVPER